MADKNLEVGRQHLLGGNAGNSHAILINRGKGSLVWDTQGKQYIDCTAQAWSLSVGHSNDAVNAAVIAQIEKGSHFRMSFETEVKLRLTAIIAGLTSPYVKDPQALMVGYAGSGSEAIEGAIKLAMRYVSGSPRPSTKIAVVENGYHGRTLATLNLSWTTPGNIFRDWAGQVLRLPLYNRHGYYTEVLESIEETIDMWYRLIEMDGDPPAALIIEPIQGKGGMWDMHPDFLRRVRRLCDELDIVLIYDEIQTGFGRVGAWYQTANIGLVKPDIMVFGKGIANGFPLFGTVSSRRFEFNPGDHSFTHGHNVVSMAAAEATINYLIEHQLLERVRTSGTLVTDRLMQMLIKYEPHIREVRGPGYMIGIEFDAGKQAGSDCHMVDAVIQYARERGVLLSESRYPGMGNVLKWKPPLVITDAEIEQSLQVMDESIALAVKEIK